MFRSSQLELQLPVCESVRESERGEERREKEERREEESGGEVRAKGISTTDRRDRENWSLPL